MTYPLVKFDGVDKMQYHTQERTSKRPWYVYA
jgi:hypothetical protein